MNEALRLDGVAKSFRGTPVLRDTSLTVDFGDCVAVTGHNGSGKSVLFRIMSRLMLPDAGTVTIHPDLLQAGNTFPVGFGVLIDRPGYIPTLGGVENLLELASIRRVIERPEILAAMDRVGLDPGHKQAVGS